MTLLITSILSIAGIALYFRKMNLKELREESGIVFFVLFNVFVILAIVAMSVLASNLGAV